MKYINLVIDNRSDHTDALYTYGCRFDDVQIGQKVYVPFAKGNRLREAYVDSLADSLPEDVEKKLKYVEKVDEEVSLTGEMMRTASWMRKRYLCRYIDAIRCFVPAGSKAKKGERQNPLADEPGERAEARTLTEEQQKVLRQIETSIQKGVHDRFLIHGVTGSGKTEIYIRAAERVVARGRSVIILVPEISLTRQAIDRFIGRFGNDAVAALHSRLTAGERYDQWKRIRDGRVKIVIGARSAVFAPLRNIGMIAVDEEHEATYKSDHTPKYDTIEVAIKRLQDKEHAGILVLGSATPSVATYNRACEGIYKLVTLTERYNKAPMPRVSIVDMRVELRAGNRSIISNELYEEMKAQLREGRQVMLFLNRRGYSTFISCRECGYVVRCQSCGLSLTYHKDTEKAVCHYCGHSEDAPHICPECGSRYIRYFGSGTEKVEETIGALFDGYKTDRLDLDTVRKKGELDRKLKAFQKGKTHILIGTQIIAKGLDFKNVGLAGIISADVALNIPDFRSPERAFQLITQAAGRAGRGERQGRVIIQTYSPEHYAVQFAARQDYEGFYETENRMRRYMGYPPYSDLIQILFTAEDEESAGRGAEDWHRRMRQALDENEKNNVFPPQQAYMSKIKDAYRFSLVIKCPKGKRRAYSEVLAKIREEEKQKKKKAYTAVIDVNPYSFV